MNKNSTGLEAFVERHRADFDAFEPHPDLWEAVEQALDAPASDAEAPLRVVPLPTIPTTPAKLASPTRRYGAAAVVAALLLAGGSYFWNMSSAPLPASKEASSALATQAAAPAPAQNNELSFYMGPAPVATEARNAPMQRLNTAVQRMETYYAAQIRERQADLYQLEQEASATPDADWRQELAALDSTYQQLKVELYRNPEPDVVLDAMNRNLQIRLDILNQQLRTRERIQEYRIAPYVLAESRRNP